ncbi:unnamed protein product [Adineta ricciae]|uniref:NAD(P)(+)--arginine ADP-ribosyltransferase n=1 Tax=Adineta ricciae TaxID=249248 RepID=A0A815BS18_ADIRI|nr:unnamed protein product [Adineta ricciae]
MANGNERLSANYNAEIENTNNGSLAIRLPLLNGEEFEHIPVVSLEIAVEPLVRFIPNIIDRAHFAKEMCLNFPNDGLTKDESASIYLYTMSWNPTNTYHDNRQVLFRGVKMNFNGNYKKDEVIAWWAFSSTTYSVDVSCSETFLGTNGERTLFAIRNIWGKNIRNYSNYPHENEVLIFPGTYFKVLSEIYVERDLRLILLEEVEPLGRYLHLRIFPNELKQLILDKSKNRMPSDEEAEKNEQIENEKLFETLVPQQQRTNTVQRFLKRFMTTINQFFIPTRPKQSNMITTDMLNSFLQRGQKSTRSCGGPACSYCGKCTDWHYNGNICEDYDQLLRHKSQNILHRHRWYVYPHATCTEDLVDINEENDDEHIICLQNNHIDSFIRHVCQCDH